MTLYIAPWQKRLESLGEGCSIFGLSTAGAILAGSGVSAGGQLAGGKKASSGATQAAQIQAGEEQQALQLQQSIYQNNANNLNPFIQFGIAGIPELQSTVSNIINNPFQPTQAQLSNMPGYQWVQNQTQASLTNQGSVSGPGGAANYQKLSQGGAIASAFEQEFYNQWLQTQQLGLTAAATPVQTGLSAAGALAGVGVASGANMANTLGNIGSALGGGVAASTNALTAGLGGATNAIGGGLSNLALVNALGSGANFNPGNQVIIPGTSTPLNTGGAPVIQS